MIAEPRRRWPATYCITGHPIIGYVVDKREYVNAYKEIGDAYREIIGRHDPTVTAVQVVALIEDRARVETEGTAIIPE
jgi:hypothetical protein